jgi:Flp pilus assembly protein TadB
MAEAAAALLVGMAVAVVVLALGGMPLHVPVLEEKARVALRSLAAGEAKRAQAAGLALGVAGIVTVELLLVSSSAGLGYLLTGMPALSLAAAGLTRGVVLGALGLRSRSLRRERQDAVVASVRTLRQLLETGAVGVTAALEILAERGPRPLRREFQAVVAGGARPAAWALARERVGEPVFDLLSAAVIVQRPGGGELGPLFRELEESVTAAHEVEREASALQVQARSASTLILCLPLAFLAVMCLLRSSYLDVYRTLPGELFLGAMLAVMGGAHVLIRHWLRLPDEPRLELADG